MPAESVPARVPSRGTRHSDPMNTQSTSAAPPESNEPRGQSVTGVDEPRSKRVRKGTDTTLPGEIKAPQLGKSKVLKPSKAAAQPKVATAAAPATAGTDKPDDSEPPHSTTFKPLPKYGDKLVVDGVLCIVTSSTAQIRLRGRHGEL